MSLLLARSQLCLLLLIDSCCYNYLVFKNEWSTANRERAVQSKEKKSPYLLHSFWSPSKIWDITYGTGISDSLKAVSFSLSEVWQPWKQKRKKVVNSLPLEMPSVWLANIFVGHGVRCSFRRWHLFPRLKSPCVCESAAILTSCTAVPSVCFRSQGHIFLPLKHHNYTASAGHTAVSNTETTRLLLTITIN